MSNFRRLGTGLPVIKIWNLCQKPELEFHNRQPLSPSPWSRTVARRRWHVVEAEVRPAISLRFEAANGRGKKVKILTNFCGLWPRPLRVAVRVKGDFIKDTNSSVQSHTSTYLSLCYSMSCQLDNGKIALSDGPLDVVKPNTDRSFLSTLGHIRFYHHIITSSVDSSAIRHPCPVHLILHSHHFPILIKFLKAKQFPIKKKKVSSAQK